MSDEDESVDSYSIWQGNSQYIYDYIYECQMGCPGITVDWLPEIQEMQTKNDQFIKQSLVLGTYSNKDRTCTLFTREFHLPHYNKIVYRLSDDIELITGNSKEKYNMFEDINKVKVMPQNQSIMAAQSKDRGVFVFIYVSSEPQYKICLFGHEDEGFGLDWSKMEAGNFVTGSQDGFICCWDMRTLSLTRYMPSYQIKIPNSRVNDVKFHPTLPNILMCGTESGEILSYDKRERNGRPSLIKQYSHGAINTIDFLRYDGNIVATGCDDRTIQIWDCRNLESPCHIIHGSDHEVHRIQFSKLQPSLLCSSGPSKKVYIWDVSKIYDDLSSESEEHGPPELVFVHNGHRDFVYDVAWNPTMPFCLSSVSNDSVLQIWKITEEIMDPNHDKNGDFCPE